MYTMYTLFGDVLSRSLLAQNPEPERGAREKRESDQGGGWISGKQHTHNFKMLKFLVFPCCACAATVSFVLLHVSIYYVCTSALL